MLSNSDAKYKLFGKARAEQESPTVLLDTPVSLWTQDLGYLSSQSPTSEFAGRLTLAIWRLHVLRYA
jgi:hypothetical protein